MLSHPLLFVSGYLASLIAGDYRPELRGLTIWDRRPDPAPAPVESAGLAD